MFGSIMRFLTAVFTPNARGAAGQIAPCELADVTLEGEFADIKKRAELSGAAYFGNILIVISNEAVGEPKRCALQLFRPNGAGSFTWLRDEPVFDPADTGAVDADLEGIAVSDDRAYVIGSHSIAADKAAHPNARRSLLALTLNPDGAVVSREPIDLARHFEQHAMFAPYAALPAEENGIDIEGIAASADHIVIGFRSPIAQDGSAPVLLLDRRTPDAPSQLRYVQLGGRGIRDMAAVSDGFLIIAGPSGKPDQPSDIVWWDGQNMAASGGANGRVKPLCRLEARKAEGIAVQAENAGGYDVMVVFDSGNRLKARSGHIRK